MLCHSGFELKHAGRDLWHDLLKGKEWDNNDAHTPGITENRRQDIKHTNQLVFGLWKRGWHTLLSSVFF